MGWRSLSSLKRTLAFNNQVELVEDWANVRARINYPNLDWDKLAANLGTPVAFINHPITGVLHIHSITVEQHMWLTGLLAQRVDVNSVVEPLMSYFVDIGAIYNVHKAALQRTAWLQHLASKRQSLITSEWAVVGGLFDSSAAPTARKYFQKIKHLMTDGDGQVDKRWAIHNDPLCMFYHQQFSHYLIPNVFPEKVKTSYCYLGIYHDQAALSKHTDREQCAWNVSVPLDSEPLCLNPDLAWPIYLEMSDGQIVEARAAIGDAIIYRGSKVPHWRKPLPLRYTQQSVCFFHFVSDSFKGSLR